jgi:catechol 2,3-dioxygenase-like lactoylglutathione lyase family enzyme
MAIRGFLSHLDLNVADVERSLPFYGLVFEYLGLERVASPPDRGVWGGTLPSGAWWGVEVRPPRERPPRRSDERYAPGIDHVALHAESRADVDGLSAALTGAGYEVADPPAEYDYTPGYDAIAFDDPDGIRIEVVYDPATNP